MAVLASDNFQRANEAPLAAPWVGNVGNVDLISNAVSYSVPSDTTNRGSHYDGSISWPNDQYSKAVLSVTCTAGGRAGPALYVRMDTVIANQTYYRFSTDHAGASNCNISRFLIGSRTEITTFTQAWTDGDMWELRVEGSASAARLRTFLNGVQISDTTDNSSIASGNPGIGVSGSASISAWSIDNWEGGSLTGGLGDDPPIGILGRGAGW